MKRIPIASFILFLTALFPVPAQAETWDVEVRNNFFSPRDLTIEVGDTVRWTNTQGFHNAKADDGSWTSETGSAGWIYERTFNSIEEVLYYCSIHSSPGANGMNGSITVVEGGANEDPMAAFTFDCTDLNCDFTDQSSDSDGSIASRSWNFGDGGNSSATNPSHAYAADGTFSVILTVTDNDGASDNVSQDVTVSAANIGPTAAFTFSCTELDCDFTDQSTDSDGSIASRSWNFGDGGNSSATNPSHAYAADGTFSVILTVTDNDGASDNVSQDVTVSAANIGPTAAFTFSCTELDCDFTDQSSDSDGSIASRSWNFGDGGNSSATNPSHAYAADGTFSVILTVTDNDGASDNVSQDVTVSAANIGPTAAFTFSCTELDCDLTDQSTDSDGSIASRSWNFGDGGNSSATNPSHAYAADGTFSVILTVTDNDGASDNVSQDVTVSAANIGPTAAFTFSCTELDCDFTDQSTDSDGSIASRSWNFGDGGNSSATNPSHAYAADGTFSVILTVTDNDGASDNVSQDVTVSAANIGPTAAFTFSCTELDCDFTDQSSDSDGSIASRSWNFGDGGNSSATNPNHAYAADGTFSVMLTVTDNDGASDNVSQDVTVSAANIGPTAAFTFSCTELDCDFTDQSSDSDGSIASRSWNFGDGGNSSATNPSHAYAADGTFSVMLTVTDNDGASDNVSQDVTVNIATIAPSADFTFSCTELDCSFTDQSMDPDGSIVSWAWGFGDGASSSAQNPTHSYATSGTYSVVLIATDDSGVEDAVIRNISVTAAQETFLINAGMTDAWYFPPTSGQGFFIVVWEGIRFIFLSWFTFDTEQAPSEVIANLGVPGQSSGTAKGPAELDETVMAILGGDGQRWVTAQGPYEGDTAVLGVFSSSGGTFDSAPPEVETVQIGTITIVWTGCNSGTLSYNYPSLGLTGEIPIERIVLDKVPQCEAGQTTQ